MSLSSLLHLVDLLRLILLQPQSDKIQDFTKSQISLKKFTIPECLLGLVTAEDLDLATIGDHLLQFINYNPGHVALLKSRKFAGFREKVLVQVLVPGAEDAGPLERFNLIYNRIKLMDEEDQKTILESLDTSSFTKKELLDLVRRDIEDVKKSQISGCALVLYKDKIVANITCKDSYFVPQHFSKMK